MDNSRLKILFDAVDIAENRLRRALEALFDLGPPDFAAKIMGMAGYRNRLTHEYNKVTPEELYEILHTRLGDFVSFCEHVARYLEETGR